VDREGKMDAGDKPPDEPRIARKRIASNLLKTAILALIGIYGALTALILSGSLRICCQTSFNIALATLALGPIIAVIAFVYWARRKNISGRMLRFNGKREGLK